MSNGYQKRLFRTPALIEPIRYCAWSMPKQRGKLCDTSSDAVYTEHGIVPRVSGLLNRAFPPAVLWLIISIIIYSSDAGSDWFLPHVRKELRVFQPPLADRNSPASVIGITRVFRIKASLDYAFPTPVGWRMDGSWGVTVLRASPYRGQHNSTATGSTFTIPNVFFPDSFLFPQSQTQNTAFLLELDSINGSASPITWSFPNLFPINDIALDMALLSSMLCLAVGVQLQLALTANMLENH